MSKRGLALVAKIMGPSVATLCINGVKLPQAQDLNSMDVKVFFQKLFLIRNFA